MPQAFFPIYPPGATPISTLVWFQKRDGMVYYFQGDLPVFSHAENDLKSFRLYTSQLVQSGNCKQVEIVEAFGVSPISVKRWVKKLRNEGSQGFFKNHAPRKPRVMTKEILQRAQALLDEGLSRNEVAEELGLKSDTLYKAIHDGRLQEVKKKPRAKPA